MLREAWLLAGSGHRLDSGLWPLARIGGEQNPDKARFCLNCGSPLTEAAPAPEPATIPDEERKLDTLVFVDLVGSTSLAERADPEDVLESARALLQPPPGRARAAAARSRNTSATRSSRTSACRLGTRTIQARRASGARHREHVAVLNAEDPIRRIQVRIGVATGEVIVRHGVRAEEGKGIAWGDVLNTAARIESAAPVDDPRRRGDLPRDCLRDRVPRARADRGEGEDGAGARAAGRRRQGSNGARANP